MEGPHNFWSWFARNEQRFRNVEVEEKEQLLDELLEALHIYCPNLWFETGRADDGISELIISAEGNIEYFSAVRTLITTAPSIHGWRFIAFKPAMGIDFRYPLCGNHVQPKKHLVLAAQVF